MKSRNLLFFIALLITTMVFVACSGSSNSDEPTPSNGSTGGDRVANSSDSATATPLPDTPNGRLAGESLTAPLLTEESGVLSRFSGQIPVTSADSDDPADISRTLIEDNPEAFGLNEDVSVANPVEYESTNRSVVSFEKTVNDIPIFGSAVRTHVSFSGDVVYIANSPSVSSDVPSDPEISLELASEKALESLVGSVSGEIAEPKLVIFNPGLLEGTESESFLAYQIDLFTDEPAYLITFIDAISGEVLFQYDDFQGALDAEIYTSKTKKTIQALKPPLGQAQLLLTEDGRVGGAPVHAEGQLALDYMKVIYDYYEDNFDWESFDGNDSQINAYVDFSTKKTMPSGAASTS